MTNLSRRHLLALAAGAVVAGSGWSNSSLALEAPEAKPVLRIGGKIGVRNDGDEAAFDIAMLDALGTDSFSTATPWTDGVSTWEGVPLAVLMKAVKADGSFIRVTALNDYVTDVPMEGLADEGAILAMRRDGELMPINNKGPLFILYPFDDRPELQRQKVMMRCAWQIARLDVL